MTPLLPRIADESGSVQSSSSAAAAAPAATAAASATEALTAAAAIAKTPAIPATAAPFEDTHQKEALAQAAARSAEEAAESQDGCSQEEGWQRLTMEHELAAMPCHGRRPAAYETLLYGDGCQRIGDVQPRMLRTEPSAARAQCAIMMCSLPAETSTLSRGGSRPCNFRPVHVLSEKTWF